MTKNPEAAGYIIQDQEGIAIYGVGATVDEAWAMVVGAVTFLDGNGDEVPASEAYETQFKTYGATAALIAEVNAKGGAIAWGVVSGVACTVAEEEAAIA